MKPKHLLTFLEYCSHKCNSRLAKLSLTKMNLAEVPITKNGITAALCELIGSCPLLRHIDLSWCSLTPKQLTMIAYELLSKKDEIRSLNLSYNVSLSAQSAPEEKEQPDPAAVDTGLLPGSKEFIDNLFEFLAENYFINHIDFSGMGLQREHLLKISHLVQEPCSVVMALHLSDNGIRSNGELLEEVLDIFDIEDECLEP